MRIGLDIDGVLLDQISAMRAVNPDMAELADPTDYHFGDWPLPSDAIQSAIEEAVLKTVDRDWGGQFLLISDEERELLQSPHFDVHLVTARPWESVPHWLASDLGVSSVWAGTHKKRKACAALQLDYLIEDSASNAADFGPGDQCTPVIIDRAWNRQWGGFRFNSIKDALLILP